VSPSEHLPSPHPPAPLRVGYVLKMYPRFSETFIVTEVLAQEAAGTQVDIFSLRPPVDARFHAALAAVQAPVTYVEHGSVRASEAWAQVREAAARLPRFTQVWPTLLRHDLRDVLQACAVATEVQRRGIQHLHAHFGSVATTVARLAGLLSGVTYSFTAHAKDIFHAEVDDEDLRVKLREAATVVTVSDFNVDHLRERFGRDAERVERIYNGIDLGHFARRATAGRARHVVAVGRLVEKKGFDDLVRAVALLAAEGDPLTCDVVGSGALHDELAALAVDLGLQDRVRLLGARTQDEVREAVGAAAVLAAPCVVGDDGNRDGLPTVVLESMALGTPVIATPVTGMPEAVVDGRTGRLVPERDPRALADAIRSLLDDETERVRLADAARLMVEDRFDRDGQAVALRGVFLRAVTGAGAGAAAGAAGAVLVGRERVVA
jgi:colanic acid/amylovoran biosynthesis glycosyltransferase